MQAVGLHDLPEDMQSLVYSKLFEHATSYAEVRKVYDGVLPISKTERRLFDKTARHAYEPLPLLEVDVLVGEDEGVPWIQAPLPHDAA